MSHSTKHFHAGRAAAAFTASQPAPRVASQRQPGAGDLTPRTPSGRDADTYERARQQRAARLGCAYLPPTPVVEGHDIPCPLEIERAVRFCAETARIALGLKKSPHLQRYLPLHDTARQHNGKQGFTYPEFYALMAEYGIPGTNQYHARILREGRGLFWNIANGIIYPCGFVELSIRLCQLAHARGFHDLYAAENYPGQRKDMYIRVSGTCAQFEGAILAAWYAAHNCPTISRWTLEKLFNRDRRSLWHIEAGAAVKIIYNEAETTEPAAVPLNADGSDVRGDVYQTTDKRTGLITFHYRLANTYQVSNIRQHHRKGQSRKALYRFRQWFDTIQLHTEGEGSTVQNLHSAVQVNRMGRIYCNDDATAKCSRKRGNGAPLFIRWKPGQGERVVWRVCIMIT